MLGTNKTYKNRVAELQSIYMKLSGSKFKIILSLVFLLLALPIMAQEPDSTNTNNITLPAEIKDTATKAEIVPLLEADSTSAVADTSSIPEYKISKGKKEKEKKEKPEFLETYLFNDSIIARHVFTWTIEPYFNKQTMGSVDTALNVNKTELPFYRNDVGATYLGVTGSATMLHNFFKRENNDIFPLFNVYSQYTHKVENVKFYNTKGPYSNLAYYTSGSKPIAEDNIFVTFTQNVSPSWNFGIHYQRMGAKGIYQNQSTDDKSFVMQTSYAGKKYSMQAGYIYNGIKNRENGGVANDFLITDTTINTTAIETRLKGALNKVSSNSYFLTHSIRLPLSFLSKKDSANTSDFIFGHSFEYTRYKRLYTDEAKDSTYFDFYDEDDPYKNYYQNHYLGKSSYDSVYNAVLDNKLFINFKPSFKFKLIETLGAGLGYSSESYYFFSPNQYLSGKSKNNQSTTYIYANASGTFKKYFLWESFLKYNFLGYRANDLLFNTLVRFSLYPIEKGIHVEGKITLSTKESNFYNKYYYSNHLKWNNDLKKELETRLEGKITIPLWELELGIKNSILSDYVYYNNDAIATQASDVVNVTAITASKNFKWGKFNMDNRFLVQFSSNSDVLPLPLFSGNTALYFSSEWVKSVLTNNLGVDVYYNTKFYDYAYNPALGMFHTQNEQKIGNYPWVDLFASFKWKRATIYVKFTNLTKGFINGDNYFSALHYPRNKRMLRLGVRWHFYN